MPHFVASHQDLHWSLKHQSIGVSIIRVNNINLSPQNNKMVQLAHHQLQKNQCSAKFSKTVLLKAYLVDNSFFIYCIGVALESVSTSSQPFFQSLYRTKICYNCYQTYHYRPHLDKHKLTHFSNHYEVYLCASFLCYCWL